MADLDLVSKLKAEDAVVKRFQMDCISPDDGKYSGASKRLVPYLSSGAEWMGNVKVQRTLLETRVEFGQADKKHLEELDAAIPKVDPLNIALIERDVTKHDQLAVLEELGRFVSPETKAMLHPGTTSYDIVDTTRAYLFRSAWKEVIRPQIANTIEQLCVVSEKSGKLLQVGRTHLKNTSPVPLTATFAGYAARLAERLEQSDRAFGSLNGKISGIVGTGASVEMVIGKGRALEFERAVLEKLGLKPDYTSTQIVQKERLADVGHGLTTLMRVLADFTNDTRILYSDAIGEVTSRDSAARLGGSSADASKDNPIEWENMTGKAVIVEAGMRILYEMISTDFQRDLRGSVQARYQPQAMMVETYEAFSRLAKALPQLSVNEDRLAANLKPIRNNPSEALVAILRGEPSWVHPQYGVGHDFVKEMAKRAKREQRTLMEVALDDKEFTKLYCRLAPEKQDILGGVLELYTGAAQEKATYNREFAREVISRN